MKQNTLKPILWFACACTLTACDVGYLPNVKTLFLNRQGAQRLAKPETQQQAYQKFVEALQYDPFLGSLHLNLGFSLELMEQADKSLKAYREAEKLALAEKNLPLLFVSRFNQAQLLGKAKQIDEAIAKYQQALEVAPSSKEVKTNIELLIQSQQGGGQGESENQDSKGDQDKKDQGQGQGEQKKQDPSKGDKGDQDKNEQDKKDQKEKDPNQGPQKSEKYKPRPFKGDELSEGDVKKILGELKQQEERIRAEYNKKETKEQPRDKDW